jgi:hypothetical protein
VKALGVFALMVGTLQVSRALADRGLADEVLEQGIQNALALLRTAEQGSSARPRAAGHEQQRPAERRGSQTK